MWRNRCATSSVKTIRSSCPRFPAHISNNEGVCLALRFGKKRKMKDSELNEPGEPSISVTVHLNDAIADWIVWSRQIDPENTSRFWLSVHVKLHLHQSWAQTPSPTTPMYERPVTLCARQVGFFPEEWKGITDSDQPSAPMLQFWYSPTRQTAHEVKSSRNNCSVELLPFGSLWRDRSKNDPFVRRAPLSSAAGERRADRRTDRQTVLKTHGSVSAPGREVLDV